MTQLQARGVVKSYGQTPALREVTLEVAKGEVGAGALAVVAVTVGVGLLFLRSSTAFEELRTD